MPLTANFLADFSSFITACRDATTSTEQLVESAGKVGADVDQAIAKVAGSIRGTATGIAEFAKSTYSVLSSSQVKDFLGDVSNEVQKFIGEFAEGEAATARLTVALKNAGQASPAVIAAYGEMATHLQSVSRFSDEAITDTQTMFTQLGTVGPENMQKVIEATMNMAVAMSKTLPEAGQTMIKAAQSDGDAIGKLSKVFGDTIPKGTDFAGILELINQKFNGQVQADMQTTAGKLENIKNQMSDINEQIGQVLADNLKTILDYFKALPEGLQTFIIAAVALGTALAPIVISLGGVVSLIGATGLGAALAAGGAAIVPFLPLIAAIAAAVLAVWAVWHYWDDMVAIVKRAVDAIKGFLVDTLPAAFKATIATVAQWYNDLKGWLYDKLLYLVQQVIKLPGMIVDAFKWMYSQIIGMSSVPDLIDGIAAHFGRLDSIMVNPALAAVADVAQGFAALTSPQLGTLTLATAGGAGGAFGGAAGPIFNTTIHMSGMFGTDDPQTRSMVADVVSNAVMQGMRGTRRLGTV